MMRNLVAIAFLALGACNQSETQHAQPKSSPSVSPYEQLRFLEVKEKGDPSLPPATLWLEVVLDRLGFSSGVIDGEMTPFDKQALAAFQQANDLARTGELDEATQQALARWQKVPATLLVRIPAAFAKGPFYPDLPHDAARQAQYRQLGYRDLTEALAERFHTTPQLLIALNGPKAKVGPDAVLRVPNTDEADPSGFGPDTRGWNATLMRLGVAAQQPEAAKVVVDKSESVLRAFDEDGKLIAQFPATMGSEHDPLPLGDWTIKGSARNPTFQYSPDLFWDVSDSEPDRKLPPGPNGPVGVVWLDLSKEHYGIHGTGEPVSIGKSESHGCVRLTNWDAARLAQMVKPGTPATFQP